MFDKCTYGGMCADFGNPSDCQINQNLRLCAWFTDVEEKFKFDNLPNLFELRYAGVILKFKNKRQIECLVCDSPQFYDGLLVFNNESFSVREYLDANKSN